jgi:glycosyltransferase involved in cell wall biosynthesis
MPTFSIVIPSYNQAQYLEASIRSVLDQDYPDCEVILMDGGSNDGSKQIIERYADRFAYWQSHSDGGQTTAIFDGFRRSTGELLTWLNSDDILLPGALRRHAEAFQRHPTADVFYGDHIEIDVIGQTVEEYKHPPYFSWLAWLTSPYIAQPGTLFTRRIWDQVGGADVNMQCAFDYELWYRFMAANAKFIHVHGFVAGFRRHSDSKGHTWLQQYKREHELLEERYGVRRGGPFARKLGRALLVGIQSLSGAYLHTLSYRLRTFRRLTAYQVP